MDEKASYEKKVDQKMARLKEKNKQMEERHKMIEEEKKLEESHNPFLNKQDFSPKKEKQRYKAHMDRPSDFKKGQKSNRQTSNNRGGKNEARKSIDHLQHDDRLHNKFYKGGATNRHHRDSDNQSETNQKATPRYFSNPLLSDSDEDSNRSHQPQSYRNEGGRGGRRSNHNKFEKKERKQEVENDEEHQRWRLQREQVERERYMRLQNKGQRLWDNNKSKMDPWGSSNGHNQSHYQHDDRMSETTDHYKHKNNKKNYHRDNFNHKEEHQEYHRRPISSRGRGNSANRGGGFNRGRGGRSPASKPTSYHHPTDLRKVIDGEVDIDEINISPPTSHQQDARKQVTKQQRQRGPRRKSTTFFNSSLSQSPRSTSLLSSPPPPKSDPPQDNHISEEQFEDVLSNNKEEDLAALMNSNQVEDWALEVEMNSPSYKQDPSSDWGASFGELSVSEKHQQNEGLTPN